MFSFLPVRLSTALCISPSAAGGWELITGAIMSMVARSVGSVFAPPAPHPLNATTIAAAPPDAMSFRVIFFILASVLCRGLSLHPQRLGREDPLRCGGFGRG